MFDEIIEKLKKYSAVDISYHTGLSISTVQNILQGRHKNPRLHTLEKLHEFIKSKE